ncbi:hypothetical protein IAU60_001184 [Kwoniella sp. DSM 27419]
MSEHTEGSNYGYTPDSAWCLAYIVLFSVSGLLHCFQAWRAKYWIVYPTLVLGCATEVLGWSARYWSSQNVTLLTPFLMQISTLIMAPVFFSAFDYVVLGMAIKRLGPQYSLLRPNLYFAIFITADIISLILQAVGGGKASASAGEGAPTQSATNIMVGGIIFQLISMGIFVILGADFIIRANSRRAYAFQERWIVKRAEQKEAKSRQRRDSEKTLTHVESDQTVVGAGGAQGVKKLTTPHDLAEAEAQQSHAEQEDERANLRAWWILLGAVLVSSIVIVVRGIYRSAELVQGWEGKLITTEMYQNILDALMMLIATGIFNVLNPGYLLPRRASWKGYH